MTTPDITYSASGFHEDCTKLLELFKQNENVRFKAFCKIWQELKFSLVFLCRKTYAEILEFCEEALYIAKQLFLSATEMIDQIGGLYLLYGLYYKIPVENVKIRVTSKEWSSFLNFNNQTCNEEFHDVSYIFVKLVKDNAFHHCLFATEYGLEKHLKTRQEYTFENPYSVLTSIIDEIETGKLARIQEMNKVYDEQKTKLLGNTTSTRKLQLYDTNFMDDIVGQIEILQEKRQMLSGLRRRMKDVNLSSKIDKANSRIYEQNKIRSQIGHGFDTDSSDDEVIDIQKNFIKTDQNLVPSLGENEDDDFDMDNSEDAPVKKNLM